MKSITTFSRPLFLVLLALGQITTAAADWTETLTAIDEPLTNVGRNAYFILEPRYQLVLAGTEGGQPIELTITVLDETLNIGGVSTRAVEKRESMGGKLIEASRNFLALGVTTKNVYCFGESVYAFQKGGRVTRGGDWREGTDGAMRGVLMPGTFTVGDRYYQSRAPKTAMDRAENVSTNETIKTPAGDFEHCLKTKETSALESGTAFKFYAPEIGLVQEGKLKLVRHDFVKK